MPKTRLTAALCSRKNDSGPKPEIKEPPITPVPSDLAPLPAHYLSSFDPNVAVDICDTSESDSDDDLPDILLSQQVCTTMPERGDPVWVKYRRDNFWPALVLQSNLRTKKLRILFLEEQQGSSLGQKLYLKYNKKKVVPFSPENRKQFEAEGRSLSGEKRKQFTMAMSAVDDYVTKRALDHAAACQFLDDSTLDQYDDVKTEEQDKDELQGKGETSDADSGDEEVEGAMMCTADTTTAAKGRKRCLTPDERRDIRKERNQPLVDYICSEEMKEHLVKIYKGLTPSERHQQFNKSVSQQNRLQGNSFGPIDDDEQLELMTSVLGKWLSEVSGHAIPNTNYLFGVWLPEAVIRSIQKVRRYSKKRALEVFDQGVRLFKCERLEIHNMMISKS